MVKYMRALFSGVVALAIFLTGVTAIAAANTIVIDGTVASIPPDMGRIQEKDSRTFVPIRFVSEFLKNEVWYDAEIKTAAIESGDDLIFIQNSNAELNVISKSTGVPRKIYMDTAAFIDASENRMYIPIRYLAESLGYVVGWDEGTQTVSLNKK